MSVTCTADSDFSGQIDGGDISALKKELSRVDCRTTPDTKVEIKNLNSFRAGGKCYEIER